MIQVREAEVADVHQISDIFRACYGEEYVYPQFYDHQHLLRMVCSDNNLLLVVEDAETGRLAGTASVIMDNTGAYSDMMGEFGRLAVHPDFRNHGVGKLLMEARIHHVQGRLHVGLVDARVVHPYTLKISEKQGFAVVGFLPLKYRFQHRESIALMAQYFGHGLTLRKNHPVIIPEIYSLACMALENCALDMDASIDDHSASYPYCDEFTLEELTTDGYASLIRIERGRLHHREIFGPLRLQYGYFKLQVTQAHYLVAKEDGRTVGAIGFIWDEFEKIVRIFELISVHDNVIRFLLASLEERARTTYDVCYMEVDISAYSPRMQRTLLELGFMPAAYVPSMVFHDVERLDVVRMVRLLMPLDLGPLQLSPAAQKIANVVMQGFASQSVLPRITQAVQEVQLFDGLNLEQVGRLARICSYQPFAPGRVIFMEDTPSTHVYLILRGSIRISKHGKELGILSTGESLGEISMLANELHFATAEIKEATECAVISHDDLARLIRERPDIGVLIYKNLACGLGHKLKRADLFPHHLSSTEVIL